MNNKIDRSDLNSNKYTRNSSIKIDNISILDENMRNLSSKYSELRNVIIDALKSFYKIQNEYTDETNFLASQEISKIIDSEIQKIVDKIDLQQEDNIDEVLTNITNSINVNYVNSPEIISNNINETDFSKIKNEILSELKNKILSLKNISNNNNNTDQDDSVKNLKAEFGNKIKTKIFDPIFNVISQNIIENIERLKKIDNLEKHINFKNFFIIIGNEIRDNYTKVTNFFKEKFESINENILKFTFFINNKITYFSNKISGFFTNAKNFIKKKIGIIISGITSTFNFVVRGIKKVFSFLVTNIIGKLFKVIGFIVKVVFNVVKTALKIVGKLLLGAAAIIYVGVGTLFSKEFWETRLGQTLKIALLTNKSFLFWTTVFITMVFKGIFKLVGFVFNLTKEVIDFFKQPSENNKLLNKIKEFLSKTYDAIITFLDSSYIILNQMCWMFGINQVSKYLLSSKSGITRMFLNPKTRLAIFGIALVGEFARREISGKNNELEENEQELAEYEQYAKETIADISSYFEGNNPLNDADIDENDQKTLNPDNIPSEFDSKDYNFDMLKNYTLDEDIKNQVNGLSEETEKTISEIKLHNNGIPSDLSLDPEISKAINDANGISETDITGDSEIKIPDQDDLNNLVKEIDDNPDFNDDNLKNIDEPFKTELSVNILTQAAELNSDLSGLNSEIEAVEENTDEPTDNSIDTNLNNYVVKQPSVKPPEPPHSKIDNDTSSLDTPQEINLPENHNQSGNTPITQTNIIPSKTSLAPIVSPTPEEKQSKELEQKPKNEETVSDNKQNLSKSEQPILKDDYKIEDPKNTKENLNKHVKQTYDKQVPVALPPLEETLVELPQEIEPENSIAQTSTPEVPKVIPSQELPQEIEPENSVAQTSTPEDPKVIPSQELPQEIEPEKTAKEAFDI
jgi:hypothetical protein